MAYKRHLIFKTGVHSPAKGEKVWTPEKVKTLFERTQKYSLDRIPYTIKHPSNNLPILGFAKKSDLRLHEKDGEVYISALPEEFADSFVSLLKQASFDKPSIAIGAKGEIVHIGLVDKPAVEGVEAAFERAEAMVSEEIEQVFSVEDIQVVWDLSGVMMTLGDLLERVKRLVGRLTSGEEIGARFDNDELKGLKEQLETLRLEREAMLREKAEAEKKARRAEFQAFLEKHVDRIPPKYHEVFLSVFEDLDKAQPRQFSKGEGEGEYEVDTSLNRLMAVLSEKKPVMVFGEVATHETKGESDGVLKALQSQFEAAKTIGIYQRSS